MGYHKHIMKKQKINTKNLISFKELKTEALKDPSVKKAYDALEFDFQIINALISARIKHKLTQRGLARKIGVAQSVLARFETGRIDPRISFVKKVTKGLGLRLAVK